MGIEKGGEQPWRPEWIAQFSPTRPPSSHLPASHSVVLDLFVAIEPLAFQGRVGR